MTVYEANDLRKTICIKDLRAGHLWGMNADSAYALIGDAFSLKAIERIHELKGRSDFMTPILIGRKETLAGIASCDVAALEPLLAAFWPGPLTLVASPNFTLAWGANQAGISIRIPQDEFTSIIARELGPIVAVGASRGKHSAPTTATQADEIWGSDVVGWVDTGAADATRTSTVIDVRGEKPNVIRLGAISFAELKAVLPSITMIAT